MVNGIKKGANNVGKVIKKTEKAVVNTITYPFKNHKRTFGQRAADNLSKWAGSWVFIIGFLVFIVIWMVTNVYAWINTWDIYPFILLNLVLSCLAALQAPIILMSQNRAAQRDRAKADFDFRINKKAEEEIREIRRTVNKLAEKFKV